MHRSASLAFRAAVNNSKRTCDVPFRKRNASAIRSFVSSASVITPTTQATDDDCTASTSSVPPQSKSEGKKLIRLSQLLSQYAVNWTGSRREAERLIRGGEVRWAGQTVTQPQLLVEYPHNEGAAAAAVFATVSGKAVRFQTEAAAAEKGPPRVWIVHKVAGELVTHDDPHGRPTVLQRLNSLLRKKHLKPIGRLDMMTEGLLLLSDSGKYAQEMERLPLHRTYRVRVHGRVTDTKLNRIRRGLTIRETGVCYRPMNVELDETTERRKRRKQRRNKAAPSNQWLTITCTQGKNRQIRRVLEHFGLTVTRLIRTSYGDYHLSTIPPGMALEVPVKPIQKQRRQGPLGSKRQRRIRSLAEEQPPQVPAIQWIRH